MNDRMIFDAGIGTTSMIIGAAGAFIPRSTSRALEMAFSPTILTAIYGVLLVAGVAILFSVTVARDIQATGYSMFGHLVSASFFLAYTVAALGAFGWTSFTAATVFIVLVLVNLFRVYEVSRLAWNARTAIITGA